MLTRVVFLSLLIMALASRSRYIMYLNGSVFTKALVANLLKSKLDNTVFRQKRSWSLM